MIGEWILYTSVDAAQWGGEVRAVLRGRTCDDELWLGETLMIFSYNWRAGPLSYRVYNFS